MKSQRPQLTVTRNSREGRRRFISLAEPDSERYRTALTARPAGPTAALLNQLDVFAASGMRIESGIPRRRACQRLAPAVVSRQIRYIRRRAVNLFYCCLLHQCVVRLRPARPLAAVSQRFQCRPQAPSNPQVRLFRNGIRQGHISPLQQGHDNCTISHLCSGTLTCCA